jgi:uncharacterized membrane protein YsdA (DUF1294 family)
MVPRSVLAAVVLLLLLLNLIAWAAFRIDKRRAERGRRRIRESTLLGLAALGGGPGALVAMYGHRRRHKVAKLRFATVVWLAALAQLALGAWLATAV